MGEQNTDLGKGSLAIYVVLAAVLAVVFILLIIYVLRQSCARIQWGWNDVWSAAPGAVATFFAARCKNVFKPTPGLGVSQEFTDIRNAYATVPPFRILLPVPVVARGGTRRQRGFDISVGVGGRGGRQTPSL